MQQRVYKVPVRDTASCGSGLSTVETWAEFQQIVVDDTVGKR